VSDIITINGESLGLKKNEIVVFNKETGEKKTVDIKGRWLYCKKCQRKEELDGIILPDKSLDNTCFVTVLAIGDRCGKDARKGLTNRRIKELKRLPDWLPYIENDIKVLDTLLCPEDHLWGIMRSPYCEDDYFIDECIVKLNLGKQNV